MINLYIRDQDEDETQAEKSVRIVNDRALSILEHIGEDRIGPAEFIKNLEVNVHGSRQKNEDEGLVRLYRGYSPQDRNEWVRCPCYAHIVFDINFQRNLPQTSTLTPYIANFAGLQQIMQSAQTLNMTDLDERLKARDEFLLSTHRHIEGHTFLQTMFKGCHAIKFAADWKRRGERPGGKKFKTNFARSIYEARTGRKPPHPRLATAEDKKLFKKFKLDHHRMVASRNDLLNLYREVRPLSFTITHDI